MYIHIGNDKHTNVENIRSENIKKYKFIHLKKPCFDNINIIEICKESDNTTKNDNKEIENDDNNLILTDEETKILINYIYNLNLYICPRNANEILINSYVNNIKDINHDIMKDNTVYRYNFNKSHCLANKTTNFKLKYKCKLFGK
jgi:hypothetical protein